MILDVEKDNVIGIITKNNSKEIKEKYDRLMKDDEAKANDYHQQVYNTKHHKDLVQVLPLNEFYKLMEHH